MIFFPNAKINIGLNIIKKRSDGYHEIESLFYPIPLKDSLEWIENKSIGLKAYEKNKNEVQRLKEIEGSGNLVLKAYELLRNDFTLPDLEFFLIKNIPMGAGLGGGSSDGAFTLVKLNQYFALGLSTNQLEKYAEKLGSDCAFFIENKPALASGRGEILQAHGLDLKGYYLILVKPPFSISTAEAYSGVIPKEPKFSLQTSLEKPIQEWKMEVFNDFENSLYPKFPELEKIKGELYDQGALYASLSGSGSTLYGIFEREKTLPDLENKNEVFYITL